MPIPEIPHISTPGNTLVGLAAGSADEMLAYYLDWRADAASVADAYRVWQRASRPQAAAHFAAYMTALDKEEATATRYSMVVKNAARG
jgi:hypothetical protein